MFAEISGTPTQIYASTFPTSETLIYTAPTTGRVVINDITVTNTTGSDVTVTVTIGAFANKTALGMYTYTVKANKNAQWFGSQVLNPGQTLYASASASNVSLVISGSERS